jgi:hypothetical protein
MLLQKLWVAFACVVLLALPAMTADASQPRVAFGFNAPRISGFPTGAVRLTGGGSFDLTTGTGNSAGGFDCLADVLQGPLSVNRSPKSVGPCLRGQGVRWDTAELLRGTTFKCTGAAGEALKPAATNDDTVVLQADFYRAGNGNDESFTAQMIVADHDLAPDIAGTQNIWVQGVGCGTAEVNFHSP